MTARDLKEAGTYDYQIRRQKYMVHSRAAKNVVQLRVDYIKTAEDSEEASLKI